MALKQMIENITKAREAYETAKSKLGEDAQQAVAEALAEHIPDGWEMYWTQYTPYFNDGDACTFSVHEPYLRREATGGEDDDRDEVEAEGDVSLSRWTIKSWSKGADYPQEKPDGLTISGMTDLIRAWESLPEDLMESAFGDHVRVTVKHNAELSVDEYSHD